MFHFRRFQLWNFCCFESSKHACRLLELLVSVFYVLSQAYYIIVQQFSKCFTIKMASLMLKASLKFQSLVPYQLLLFQIRELILKCDLWYYQCLKIFSCFRIVNPIILVSSALVIKYNCYCLKELVNNDGLSTLKHPKKLYRFFMHVIITAHRMNHNYRPVKQKNA